MISVITLLDYVKQEIDKEAGLTKNKSRLTQLKLNQIKEQKKLFLELNDYKMLNDYKKILLPLIPIDKVKHKQLKLHKYS